MIEYSIMAEHNKRERETEHAENKGKEPGAAVIIHSRTRYGDYREGLLVRPADMSKEQVYQWKKQILRCTGEPEEMRTMHQVRRAVISDGVYGAVGVAAYFRDIALSSFEDEGRRPAYGFVGFIWKINSGFRPSAFPSMADFRYLTERYVVPRWEEPKNGMNTEKATLSAYQECWDSTSDMREIYRRPESPERLKQDEWPGIRDMDSDLSVKQALERAVRGENVFYCTGLPEPPQEQAEDQKYVADTGAGEPIKIAGEVPGDASKHRLIRAVITAAFLCGAVIWALLFR